MQECGALEPDLNEGCLHARQHPTHSSFVDIADETAMVGSLDEDLLQHATFDQGGAHFSRADID
jgi:hypothetical protein